MPKTAKFTDQANRDHNKIDSFEQYLSMQLNDQAVLAQLMIYLFQAYTFETKSTFDTVLEGYYLGEEGLFKELATRLDKESEKNTSIAPVKPYSVNIENETVAISDHEVSSGAYFGIIFWDQFITDFQIKVNPILSNQLDTKILLHRAWYETLCREKKDSSLVNASLNRLLHGELIAHHKLSEQETLLSQLNMK